MTDGYKHPVWSTEYLPFGETYNTTGATGFGNDFRFPGQVHDGETGLHYNWHRYYKPQLGRYVQADPVGLAGGINLYSYASSNPINRWDPFGLRTYSCAETEEIIKETGEQNLLEAFLSHSGSGKYDFKIRAESDTFNVGGNLLRADEFGNYLAGYSGYKSGGMFGYYGVRAGGIYYDFVDLFTKASLRATRRPYGDSRFDFDADSQEQIDAGTFRAMMEDMGVRVHGCPCK